MIEEVFMPRWGITMKEGKIVKWLVAGGDEITSGQALCEVSTEKIVQSIESPMDGTVVELLHQTGSTVPVGKPILLVDNGNSRA